ncbi:hypothetical protein MVLG_05052 [Microbotryum lychnidis-dioicae p1A1 Lamole]|uniref:mannan endo-1,4-beta-mannosidase n=1 Tax=Microbotryum lychnidis-dioicae (strain p1A1 Lamole / MvSl-1064) TaxID=683840 RepID=U5HD34_USTV1|nr:hypothetical protein MVLG_05052 [Microbotryum lychnidis-dioicae p1A1 Lamole]|eukprot:KDE04485.1 hypothetical protein MVLG_05052 [Microbotryum lychnidis-dioicae p1A1 Lamole]
MLTPRVVVLTLAYSVLRWTALPQDLSSSSSLRSSFFVSAHSGPSSGTAHDAAAAAAAGRPAHENDVYAAADGESLSSVYERAAWVDEGDLPQDEQFMIGGDSVLRNLGHVGSMLDNEGSGGDLDKRWPPNPKWTMRKSPAATTPSRTTTKGNSATPVVPPATTTTTTTETTTTMPKTTTTPTTTPVQNPNVTTTATGYTLPKPPSSTCGAPYYSNTAGGVIYGARIGNVAWRAVPTSFVKRNGAYLTLDGKGYRIVGPNAYWLGLDENVNYGISYPDKSRIREVMAVTVALGGNTIRSHSLGVSTGNSLSVWPNAYSTNLNAFDTIDYAIYAARAYGLRLIIPFTDQYTYYHGGKYDFIRWAGGDTSDGNSFYWNSDIVKIFKDYIKMYLNHVNTYTGVALKDDPTILGWETGNEFGAYMLGAGAPPATWTSNIASYIKSIAPNHLIFDGTNGLVDSSGFLRNTGVSVANVDVVTDHFYPALDWLLSKGQTMMGSYLKSFFIGELDWTGMKGGSDMASFYSTIESWGSSGSMAWNLMSHDGQCCNWIYHNDGYSIYYPNGHTQAEQASLLALAQHWHRMRGLTPPTVLAAVACPQLPIPS